MSLLQDPIKALDQIDWYLTHQQEEQLPGSFLLAAGNLARQTLEQVLFILAFYGGMPSSTYMKPNWQLHTANHILTALKKVNLLTNRTYLAEARRRGPRIRKFARYPRSLNMWRDQFNSFSHFRNPATNRRIGKAAIEAFSKRIRGVFDERDCHLITAAVNELGTRGKVTAVLMNTADNTPGVSADIVVAPKDLERSGDGIALRTPWFPIHVVPNDREVPLRWTNRIILVQHSVGMTIQSRLITESGDPIDLSNGETVLLSFTKTHEGQKRLRRHLKRLGLKVELKSRD
jgi:hypothetical protein